MTIDEPITIVLFTRPLCVASGVIVHEDRMAIRIKVGPPWRGVAFRAKSREGMSWIRGHHAEDSEEIQALLAAAALYDSQNGGS